MLNRIRCSIPKLLKFSQIRQLKNIKNHIINPQYDKNIKSRMSSIIANIGNRDERIMNINLNDVEYLETPDKSESDPKEYR